MPLFDAYVMVDWSAAATRTHGKDSIWIGAFERQGSTLAQTALENPGTRTEATERTCELLAACLTRGLRVLAEFDFPFGYPSGTCDRLGINGLKWRHLWSLLSDKLEDGTDNANNRFVVGAHLNERLYAEPFPFWGRDGKHERPFLTAKKSRRHGEGNLAERRLCEHRIRKTQPTWKLAYTGSVGGQALTGIPRVWQIRRDPRLAMETHIWPFETGLEADQRPRVVLAEVYPSLVEPEDLDPLPKDAGQVSAIAKHFAGLDSEEALAPLFAGDPSLSDMERQAIIDEEAWILGVTGASP